MSSTWVLKAHLIDHGPQFGAGPFTTASVDTTGSDILIVITTYDWDQNTPALSDSNVNTWHQLTQYGSDGSNTARHVNIWYAIAPTVGSGHTFTFDTAGHSPFGTVNVLGFSGAHQTSPFDVENGATSGATTQTTLQPGNVTPSQPNSLIVTVLATKNGAATWAINSGLAIEDTLDGIAFTNSAAASAFIVQNGPAVVNPLWTTTDSDLQTAAIAVFKPPTAVPVSLRRGRLRRVVDVSSPGTFF